MKKQAESLPITTWSLADRPREKLLAKGKQTLTNAELLAILIGSGNRNESAVNLCQRIMKSHQNLLQNIAKTNVEELMQFKGIGEAKAITIVAALELGRRRRSEDAHELTKIKSSQDVYHLMYAYIGELSHEEFWIMMLNNSNKVIHKYNLSKGGITATMVDIRLLFKKALSQSATSIILTHNHPSGTLKPSQADKQLTAKVKKAGEILDIKVLDHLIITEKSYFSFADEGLL
ncbi:MAG: RadC family protein [Psychroflexus halocasei]